MSIQGVKRTIEQFKNYCLSSNETKPVEKQAIDVAIDYLLDFDRNPYEFEPQTPIELGNVLLNRSVRFLGNDGGIKSGVIVMCIPRGYRSDNWWYYRVLDVRRMELYDIRGDQLQMMPTRKD